MTVAANESDPRARATANETLAGALNAETVERVRRRPGQCR